MKISEFSRKFGIGINTVRYYVNIGLLVPDKHNGQYRFNEQNAEDMRLISRLKKFDFSIGQIHKIISLIRLSNLTVKEDVNDFLSILANQQETLQLKALALAQSIGELDHYMESVRRLGNQVVVNPRKTGVPLEFAPYLCCPHCERALNFKNASIENSSIMHSLAVCECGYRAKIDDGILITEGRYISELDWPDLSRKFYKDLPASWITLFQKSYNWIFSRMKEMNLKGKIVLENHINCYFFLNTVLERLDKDALYIISDKYPEIVAMYKELIESRNPELKILYLADSSFAYPLKKRCVDLYIDYSAINEYAFFNNQHDLISVMLPYLKSDMNMLGTYFYFDSGSASHRKMLSEYPCGMPSNYLLSLYKDCLHHNNLQPEEYEHNGFVTDWGGANRNFSFHAAGDKMHLLSYHCKL